MHDFERRFVLWCEGRPPPSGTRPHASGVGGWSTSTGDREVCTGDREVCTGDREVGVWSTGARAHEVFALAEGAEEAEEAGPTGESDMLARLSDRKRAELEAKAKAKAKAKAEGAEAKDSSEARRRPCIWPAAAAAAAAYHRFLSTAEGLRALDAVLAPLSSNICKVLVLIRHMHTMPLYPYIYEIRTFCVCVRIHTRCLHTIHTDVNSTACPSFMPAFIHINHSFIPLVNVL